MLSKNVCEAMNKIRNTSDSSKCMYYKTINSNMQIHSIYKLKNKVNELKSFIDK